MSDDWPIAGTLLATRYRLVGLLETGGMAEIWRADDELLGRPVAVKLPTGPQVAWREARMAARLSHPGIAAVHDYREAVRPDGTIAPFVVMELLAGETVAARLVRDPIGLPEAARIGAAVAVALAAAHTNGVVHRDVKPGNVMLTPNGVKILDFGISAAAGEPDDDDTGATFGTPAYVAPERLDGKPAEPATDVYGLGVLLFEMVTGEPPYPVDTWEELAAARADGLPTLPTRFPAEFRALVARCLDDDPDNRPGADEVRYDLTALWLSASATPQPTTTPDEAAWPVSPPGAEPTIFTGPQPTIPADFQRPVPPTAQPSTPAAASPADSPHASPAAASPAAPPPSAPTGPHASPADPPSPSPADPPFASPAGSPLARPAASAGTRPSARPGPKPAQPTSPGSPPRARPTSPAGPQRTRPTSPAGPQRTRPHSAAGAESAPRSSFPYGGDTAQSAFPASRGPAGQPGGRSDRRSGPVSGAPAGAAGPGGRSFASGRAPAATVPMTQPPQRRRAFSLTLIALVLAVAGIVAAINWPRPDTTAGQNSAPAPAPPLSAAPQPLEELTTTPPTTSPAQSPSESPSQTPSPKPAATLTFADAVTRMRTAIEDGAAGGEIRTDVATDLLNLLKPLTGADGRDVDGQLDQLRRKIRERLGEGSVSPARADILQSRLADLDRAAGT